jgi:hypothetical protein
MIRIEQGPPHAFSSLVAIAIGLAVLAIVLALG